ncbi:hypothetical protein Bca101_051807 [Brassica carinata]
MPSSLGMNSHTETKSRSFWEARNVKKYGQLMDVDMLLIDKQHSTLIQGNVNDNRIEGSVYSLSTCLFSGAHVLFDSVKLLSLANTNKQLPGNVCVSPFDDLTFAFHNKLESYGSEPKVVLVTSINPKLSVKDSMKSKYLLQIQVVWGWFNQPASTSKLVHAQKIEPLTLSELNQYVLTSASQTFTFTEQQRPPLPDFVIHVACLVGRLLKGEEPNDDVPVEKPVASNVSIGADNTLAEVASGVGAEVGETTSANHSHPHLLLQD